MKKEELEYIKTEFKNFGRPSAKNSKKMFDYIQQLQKDKELLDECIKELQDENTHFRTCQFKWAERHVKLQNIITQLQKDKQLKEIANDIIYELRAIVENISTYTDEEELEWKKIIKDFKNKINNI